MVTKYERELQRDDEAKRMRAHADEVHAVGSRVPFWRLDDAQIKAALRQVQRRSRRR